jgi:hypothetical protein
MGMQKLAVALKAIKWVGGLLLAVAIGGWCWFIVPWTPQDCWQVIARADGLHGEEYAVAQEYKGFFGDLYSVNFYYRTDHEGPWTGYWLAYDDPYWRVKIVIDPMSGKVTIEHWDEGVAVFDGSSGTFKHRLHRNSTTLQVEVKNPQSCPAD